MVGVFSVLVFYFWLGYFNYGSCVDVYGWGENIDIIFINVDGIVNNLYIIGFSGIFGVSLIIVGVVVVVQGIVQVRFGCKLSFVRVRIILIIFGIVSCIFFFDCIGVLFNFKVIIDGGYIRVQMRYGVIGWIVDRGVFWDF